MPVRYNNRQSSMYRYNEPSISQYESFFNPVPLEFVQQQFDRRQGAYDEGYGMAIAAKDQFGGAKVGAPDIAYKNQLIGKYVDDIDKTVQDQFGGDYGKAAKAIARTVTEVRGNEFWQKAQMMDQLREEERKLTAQYGPDALKFRSLQDRSVVDPKTGKMISSEEMKYDVIKKGDWEGSVAKMFSGLKPDQKENMLRQYKGDPSIQNYLQYGTTEGISDEKLRMLANDPNIRSAFLASNQDFGRVANELPGYFGASEIDPVTGKRKSAEELAGDYIYGQIKSRQYSQSQSSYTHDAGAEARQKAAAEAKGLSGETSTSITTPIEKTDFRGVKKINENRFGNNGEFLTAEQRMIRNQKQKDINKQSVLNIPMTGIQAIDNLLLLQKSWEGVVKPSLKVALRATPGLNAIGNAILDGSQNVQQFAFKLQEEKDRQVLNEIKQENPEITINPITGKNRTDAEIWTAKQTADEKLTQQTGKIWTISPDWQEAQTRSMIMNDGTLGPIFNQELYVDGKHISGEKKVKMFQEELGIKNDDELKEVLKSARVQGINYTGRTPGELTINVIGKDGKPHTVEMSPNDQMQSVATPVYMLSEIIRTNGTSGDINRFSVNGESATQTDDGSWIVPSGSEVQGKKIYYIVNSQIDVQGAGKEIKGSYNPTIYLVDQDGNLFKDEEGNPVTEDLTNIVKHTENSIKKFGISYTNKNKQTISQN